MGYYKIISQGLHYTPKGYELVTYLLLEHVIVIYSITLFLFLF